jgi:hypothetical protein
MALPNHSRDDLHVIERLRREAEAEARHHWHSPEIREMAVFNDDEHRAEQARRHFHAAMRREVLVLSAAAIALLLAGFVCGLAAPWAVLAWR